MSLEETISKLNTIKDTLEEFDENDLSELSGISPSEIDKFAGWWASLNELRKLNLIQKINQIAEENFELEFTEILYFANCLVIEDKTPGLSLTSSLRYKGFE